MAWNVFALGVVLSVLATQIAPGQTRPSVDQRQPNAASVYHKAFGQLPRQTSDIVAAAAKAKTIDWLAPIDPKEVANVLDHADPAIALLHQAALEKRCDWGETFAATQPTATKPTDIQSAANDLYFSEALRLIALGGTKSAALFDQKHPDQAAECACDTRWSFAFDVRREEDCLWGWYR